VRRQARPGVLEMVRLGSGRWKQMPPDNGFLPIQSLRPLPPLLYEAERRTSLRAWILRGLSAVRRQGPDNPPQ